MTMKKTLAIGLLSVFGVLGFQEAAQADWRFSWGFGSGGGYFSSGYYSDRHERRARRHQRRRACRPCYRKVWVEPVYRQIGGAYTECGQPIYERVCVREGYYRHVRIRR